ncbi:MAG TPA: DUF2934 domain-containing protein [Kofleriaceae bacterium]|nr:DUF2934 domain-containing protein [Kofleriaceae bacterium]
MGKSSKNSITRSSTRPARRARRGTAAAETVAIEAAAAPAEAAVEAAAVEAAAPEAAAVETAAPEAGAPAPAEAAPAPAHHQVQQLAFHYYAESGFAQGNALDHWLRAETELTGE